MLRIHILTCMLLICQKLCPNVKIIINVSHRDEAALIKYGFVMYQFKNDLRKHCDCSLCDT